MSDNQKSSKVFTGDMKMEHWVIKLVKKYVWMSFIAIIMMILSFKNQYNISIKNKSYLTKTSRNITI